MNAEQVVGVYSDKSLQHRPPFDIYNGIISPSFDVPERSEVLIKELTALHESDLLQLQQTRLYGLPVVYQVHDEQYVTHLKKTSERVASKPSVRLPMFKNGNETEVEVREYPAFAYPSVFPHGVHPQSHNRVSDRGLYSFDTSTPVMGNTFEVALDSAYTALTASELLLQNHRFTYALCRPPGHHAERSKMGGYCYLNNAAISAEYLRSQTGRKIAVVDIDAHHGNGTQDIFYATDEIFFGSIHVDPREKPPYYTGYAEEKGQGKGYGYNLNIPLPLNTDDSIFLQYFDILLGEALKTNPGTIVVSLGFDGHKNDPLQIFQLTTDCFSQIAKRLANTNLPVLTVQEGGYSIPDLGSNISAYLKGLQNIS